MLLGILLYNTFAANVQPNSKLVHLLLLSRRLRTFLLWARLAVALCAEKRGSKITQNTAAGNCVVTELIARSKNTSSSYELSSKSLLSGRLSTSAFACIPRHTSPVHVSPTDTRRPLQWLNFFVLIAKQISARDQDSKRPLLSSGPNKDGSSKNRLAHFGSCAQYLALCLENSARRGARR